MVSALNLHFSSHASRTSSLNIAKEAYRNKTKTSFPILDSFKIILCCTLNAQTTFILACILIRRPIFIPQLIS
jgi:hypothetical protein